MSSDNLSQKEQENIVDELISRLDEMGPEDDFDEELYNKLDDWHKSQVDDAIRRTRCPRCVKALLCRGPFLS